MKLTAWYVRLNREQKQSLCFGVAWPLGGVLFAVLVGSQTGEWGGAWKASCCFFALGFLFLALLAASLYTENSRVRELKKMQRARAKLEAERTKQRHLNILLAAENERLTTEYERAKLDLKHSD